MEIKVVRANYSDIKHENAIQNLLDLYALDPMGGGMALDVNVRNNVVKELSKLP